MIHTAASECPGCGRPVNRRDAATVQLHGCDWHSCCYMRAQDPQAPTWTRVYYKDMDTGRIECGWSEVEA
jgi:hypothetical protein